MLIFPEFKIAPVGHTLSQALHGLPHSFFLFKKFIILTFPKTAKPAPIGQIYLQ